MWYKLEIRDENIESFLESASSFQEIVLKMVLHSTMPTNEKKERIKTDCTMSKSDKTSFHYK